MVRQAAFEGKNKMLKTALHVHTTRSDGAGTPEEVLKKYKDCGYDVVALTDHRFYNFENFAPELGLLIIPGMEIDASICKWSEGVHCYHTVVLGHGRENNPFEQDQRVDTLNDATQESFQKLLDHYHKANQLTMYCHPEWSNTPAREFERLEGNFAMEIWNSGCAIECGLDTNAAWWDELLMQGKRIFGCATDDGHAMDNHANGWVCVNAEKELDSVLAALQDGAFYSSCGPEIKDFYISDGKAVVECSPCCDVAFRSGCWPLIKKNDKAGGITHCETNIPDFVDYVRVTVTDKEGRRAWSNPIFMK